MWRSVRRATWARSMGTKPAPRISKPSTLYEQSHDAITSLGALSVCRSRPRARTLEAFAEGRLEGFSNAEVLKLYREATAKPTWSARRTWKFACSLIQTIPPANGLLVDYGPYAVISGCLRRCQPWRTMQAMLQRDGSWNCYEAKWARRRSVHAPSISRLSISRVLPKRAAASATSGSRGASAEGAPRSARRRTTR